MAPAAGLTLPSLEGVPASFVRNDGWPAAAAIARRLIEVGVADPAEWKRSNGDPLAFLDATLRGWASEAGASDAGEHLGVEAYLASDLGVFFDSDAEEPDLERVWIAIAPACWHSIIHMGHVSTLLGSVHPRLPATFDQWFRTALGAVARLWDHSAAEDWMDAYGDWIFEQCAEAAAHGEEMPWPIEITGDYSFRVKDLRLLVLRRKPLAETTVRRLLRSMPPRVRTIMDLTLELAAAAKAIPARRYPESFGQQVSEYEFQEPPPLLVMVGQRYDAIEVAWDEENMAMSQVGEHPLPYVAFQCNSLDDEELLQAHRDFVAVSRVFALSARIVALLPDKDPSTLAEVLQEAGA